MRTLVTITILTALSTTAGFAAGDAKAGLAVYTNARKSCHGADGVANPAIAKMMKVEMKDLGSADVQSASDADIKKIITAGKGKMHAVASVTGASVDDVIAYVRTLKK